MAQYEFSEQQNALIGSLAGKMNFVGLFAVLVGVFNLIVAVLVVVGIYRDRVPASVVDRLPAEAKKQYDEHVKGKLPANNYLWGIAINAAAVGLFQLLMGVWTRSAAVSFHQIVTTQGRDISHLMNALDSLYSMYALIYTLLMITMIIGLIGIALTLWQAFA